MSNLYVIGAFVATAFSIVDLDGKSSAIFRDFTLFMHNLFRIFHPTPDFFHFIQFFSFGNNFFSRFFPRFWSKHPVVNGVYVENLDIGLPLAWAYNLYMTLRHWYNREITSYNTSHLRQRKLLPISVDNFYCQIKINKI